MKSVAPSFDNTQVLVSFKIFEKTFVGLEVEQSSDENI